MADTLSAKTLGFSQQNKRFKKFNSVEAHTDDHTRLLIPNATRDALGAALIIEVGHAIHVHNDAATSRSGSRPASSTA